MRYFLRTVEQYRNAPVGTRVAELGWSAAAAQCWGRWLVRDVTRWRNAAGTPASHEQVAGGPREIIQWGKS